MDNYYCIIRWIEVYPVDSVIHLLKNWDLVSKIYTLHFELVYYLPFLFIWN